MCVFLQEDGDISAYAVEQTIHMEKHQETKIKPFDEVDKGHKISVGKASISLLMTADKFWCPKIYACNKTECRDVS